MSRVMLNMKYKIRYQFTWLLYYLVIYFLVMFILTYGLIQTSLISSESGGFFYRIWGLLFFQLAISLKFQEDFDFFLMLSNTRKAIFQSLLGVAVVFSALLSLIIILERIIVDYLNNIFGFQFITDPFHFIAPYVTDNLFLQYIFFLMLCIWFSVMGLLLGSLAYRFGKIFVLAAWLIISAVFILFLPWFLWNLFTSNEMSNFIETVSTAIANFDLLASSGYLLIFSIVFVVAAYLNIRGLPQK